MLFKLKKKQLIEEQWRQITEARERCANIWQENWQSAYDGLVAAFAHAAETDALEAWAGLSLRGRQLRELMSAADGEEATLYLKLVKLTDTVEAALDEAATSGNLIPRGELRELIQQIDRQSALIAEERRNTSIFQQEQRRRLDEIEERIKAGKRTILHVEEFSLISLGVDELISAIKDGIIAIRNGVELLDERFTERLRRGGQKLWQAAKRFVRVTKERFAAFRLPWRKDAADEQFERADPTFGLPPETENGPPRGISILVRNGNQDREEWRVPGGGAPFQDRWEERGRRFSGPGMVVVPAGEFMMGSPDGEGGADDRPQHRVFIPKPFAIGRYPVTFAEWDACVAAGGVSHEPEAKWGRGNQPVMNVSWEDAQAYIAWLRKVTGKDYRFPSEAEWEYAARAGTRTRYSFGDSEAGLNDYGWSDANSGGKTHPVGGKKPNPWGLYDVHGNVWEWCEDEWHDSYAGKPDALKANGGAWTTGGGGRRVLRGGSWNSDPRYLRAADRFRITADDRYLYSGFRLARTLNP